MPRFAHSTQPAVLALRAHHIYCSNFLDLDLRHRGQDFLEMKHRTSMALREEAATVVRVTEGVDAICNACSLCRDNRCESPNGNEEEVRKWDHLVLKGLGLQPGDILPVARLWEIFRLRSPIPLCERCQWRQNCRQPGRTI